MNYEWRIVIDEWSDDLKLPMIRVKDGSGPEAKGRTERS